MPNGFEGSAQEWERIESPLRTLDPALLAFANRHGWQPSRNYHDWPERSLVSGHTIRRVIQIYLEDPVTLTWNVWLCASEDRDGKRYWKKQFLRRAVPMEEIARQIDPLLDEAMSVLLSWKETDLEFATKLAQ